MTTSKSIKRNQLSYRQMFLLSNWLKENQAQLQRKTRQEIADKAKEALGFEEVSIGNIRGAIEAAGVEIQFSTGPRSKNGGPPKDRVRALSRELLLLVQQLGQEPSARLKQLAECRAQD